jgi:hypothetical protein
MALPVVLAALSLLVASCLIDVERGKYVQGRTLTVGVTQIRKLPEVGYSNADRTVHYVIRPKDPQANILAVASVTVSNFRSAKVLMFVDTSSAYVDDDKNKRYQVLDPFTDREEVSKAVKDENLYAPFLWQTIQLDQDTQIVGWMVFEMPKDREVLRFGWQQGENIVVRFTEP